MSDRLRNLLATIDRALYGQGSAGFSPAHELLVSGWMLALQEEIAERERPLEGALAEVVKHARAALSFVRLDAPEERQPSMSARLKGAASELDEAIASLEALALRGARPATRAEWAAIAADLAQDEGEVVATLPAPEPQAEGEDERPAPLSLLDELATARRALERVRIGIVEYTADVLITSAFEEIAAFVGAPDYTDPREVYRAVSERESELLSRIAAAREEASELREELERIRGVLRAALGEGP